MPFDDSSFDIVTCIGTFVNFGKKKYKISEEMKRVVKKEGHTIIGVCYDKALPERMRIYNKLANKRN